MYGKRKRLTAWTEVNIKVTLSETKYNKFNLFESEYVIYKYIFAFCVYKKKDFNSCLFK